MYTSVFLPALWLHHKHRFPFHGKSYIIGILMHSSVQTNCIRQEPSTFRLSVQDCKLGYVFWTKGGDRAGQPDFRSTPYRFLHHSLTAGAPRIKNRITAFCGYALARVSLLSNNLFFVLLFGWVLCWPGISTSVTMSCQVSGASFCMGCSFIILCRPGLPSPEPVWQVFLELTSADLQ